MRISFGHAAFALFSILAAALTRAAEPIPIPLPDGTHGVGLDDLGFSAALDRVLVPAGATGSLDLIDPKTRSITRVSGFSAAGGRGGHGDGTTSADEGEGRLFASDRTSLELAVVDPKSAKIVARTKLASGPDYVRWIAPTREVWVTQPDEERIEIFSLAGEPSPPRHEAFLSVPGGPESLVVDRKRGRAYSNLWKSTTVAIDLKRREIVGRWKNGCEGSRGIALDAEHGLVFVGCTEGKAVALDASTGNILGSAEAPKGIDIIDFNPRLSHLSVPGGKDAKLAIFGVSSRGVLSLLGTFPAAVGSHCVTSDAGGHVYVCDPRGGRLLLYSDPFPAASP